VKELEWREECGVFGVFAPGKDVARLIYFGLFALQHRGQESAGLAVADGKSVLVYKELGLVNQVFNERNLASLKGHLAIGHVRYSTTGSPFWENAQPIYEESERGVIALAHNGNLLNTQKLRKELEARGHEFRSTSDTEVIAKLIAERDGKNIEEAIRETVHLLRGAYSLAILTEDKLIGVRDPYGIRPLSLGKLDNGYVIASETCALNIVGAEYVREIEPGEMVVIDENGLFSSQLFMESFPSLCIFEFIYFARPDSLLYGKNLYEARKEMGRLLAREAPALGDMVIPIPDSGTPAAVGYAEESGIPYSEGLIKNRYVGRTFIQPTQDIRQLGVKVKLNPLVDLIKGKRLVVVDDSIVRGNTSQKIVLMLKEAGAKEVHMRISSPPVKFPCFYGIDTANQDELIAARKSVEEIRRFVGADSLVYLSLKSLVKATGNPGNKFCRACLDGIYPIPVPREVKLTKFVLERDKGE
jgi:amidophosphoribosyltransferase